MRFRQAFQHGHQAIRKFDYFFQTTQIHAWHRLVLFSEIEKIGKGGYGTFFELKGK